MEPVFTPPSTSRWYKRPSGITLIIFLTLIILGALGFVGLIGYYSFKISKGEGEDIIPVAGGFTKAALASQTNKKIITADDILSTISSNTPMKGKESAPVTVVMFMDFECPFSQSSHDIFDQMMRQHGNTVKMVFKQFPITSIHSQAASAALAATCAHEQNKFWEYYDALFDEQTLTDETYSALARTLKLNPSQFDSCFSSQKNLSQIEQDVADGIRLGVQGTPTYFVNTKKIEGVPTPSQWNSILLQEIKK